MRKRILLSFAIIVIISSSVYSQSYKHVDEAVESYPKSIKKLEQLTDLIKQDFVLDEERARAVYRWIAFNIAYDTEAKKSLQHRYTYSTEENRIAIERKVRSKWAKECVKKGKAECEGYATLYKCFCDLLDVECVIIPGNTKRHEDNIGDSSLPVNHAWNAVKINKEWKFVDVTWAAGYINYSINTFNRIFDKTYFLTPPDRYFYNHFPKDTTYLFVDRTAQEYIDLPIYYSEFLRTDYEIIEPESGILMISGEDKVSFRIKSPKGVDRLSYSFDEELVLYDIKIYKEDDDYVFKIQFPEERKSILNLYFKRRGIATYKIVNI